MFFDCKVAALAEYLEKRHPESTFVHLIHLQMYKVHLLFFLFYLLVYAELSSENCGNIS